MSPGCANAAPSESSRTHCTSACSATPPANALAVTTPQVAIAAPRSSRNVWAACNADVAATAIATHKSAP